jgi:hypothetical protein
MNKKEIAITAVLMIAAIYNLASFAAQTDCMTYGVLEGRSVSYSYFSCEKE